MASEDLSGTTILHYHLQEQLRQRTMTDLYLAQDEQAQQIVFFEIVRAHPDQVELNGRFQRRMETVSQLQHAGIAPIIEIGITPDKQAYAVIEYVAGRRLSELMADPAFRPDPTEALALIKKLARILQVGHPVGIFHHDLRPANILMRDRQTPILIDLGIPITTTRASRDTINEMRWLDYSSPEQLDGKPLTSCSNIYSLGVILYELLVGHQPRLPRSQWDIFERSQLPQEIPLEEVRADLATETYAVVRTCLWRAEWSRYQTLSDLIAALETAILAEKSAPETNRKRPFTRQQLIIAAIVLAVLLVAVAALLLTRGGA